MTSTNPTHHGTDDAPAVIPLDDLWRCANHRLISRAEALDGVRAILNVTDAGAAEILDNPRPPSERYAQEPR